MAKEYYHYEPSLAAAVIFVVLFVASAILHIYQLVKTKTWYFIAFVFGCIVEAIGFAGRAIGAQQTPDWDLGPYIMQSLLLLLGPALFAVSIYMILGRLILVVDGERHCIIKLRWLTKFFLLGDILSIAGQGIGGAKLAGANSQSDRDVGQTIIIIGLFIQIVFFGLFMVTTCIFHYRINRHPTSTSLHIGIPWKRLLWALYASSMLILVRSVFRVIEYIQGSDGELQSKEFYIYVFDAALMILVAAIFHIVHPSQFLPTEKQSSKASPDADIQIGSYGSLPV